MLRFQQAFIIEIVCFKRLNDVVYSIANKKQKAPQKRVEEDDTEGDILFWKPNMKPEDVFTEDELKEYYEAEKEFLKNIQSTDNTKDQKQDLDQFLLQQNINPNDLVGYNTIANHNVDLLKEMEESSKEEMENDNSNPLESLQFLSSMTNDIEQLMKENPQVQKEFDQWIQNFITVMNKENETKTEMSESELDSVCNIPKEISDLINNKYNKQLNKLGISLNFV